MAFWLACSTGCYKPSLPKQSELWQINEIDEPSVSGEPQAEEPSVVDSDSSAVGNKNQDSRTDSADDVQLSAVNDEPWIDSQSLPWRADYVQYKQGRQIGFSRVDVEDSREQLRILRSDWILSSMGATDARTNIWTEHKLEAIESRTGQLREFTLVRNFGERNETIKGTLQRDTQGAKLRLSTDTKQDADEDGIKTHASIPWQEGSWGSLGIQSLLMRQPMQPGEKRMATVLIPGMNQIAEVQLVAGSLELTPLAGGRAPELLPIDVLMLTKTSDNELMGTQSRNWVNERGEIEKTLELTGARVTTFRVTRETTERLVAAVEMERMLNQQVDLELAPGETWDANSPLDTAFVIEMERIDPASVFLKTSVQRVESLDARSSRITVRPSSLGELIPFDTSNDQPPTSAETNPSQWIRSDHSLIKTLGERVAPADATPLEFARSATRLIADRVPLTSLDTSPPNSMNALQARKGDFVDHACLLAAVLRQRAIPARVVGGLKVEAGAIPRLVFWMWTEAWINERWIGLDATSGTPVGRGYLAIGRDDLAAENPYTMILSVMRHIGAVSRAQLEE